MIRFRLPAAMTSLSSAGMLLTATLLAAAPGPLRAGTFSEVTGFGSNPGNLKMFTYLPESLPDPAPLVVILHGCNQTALGYLENSGWDTVADEMGAALLLPEQQIGPGPIFTPTGLNHLTRCFNFAERRDSTRDSGEALSIRQMVDATATSLPIDPGRIFVNGLSAGGGMTSVMLATYPDVFAAGAVIAGLPYRCGTTTLNAETDCGVTLQGRPHKPAPDETPEEWGRRVRAAVPDFAGPWPRVSIWQGTADGTVDPGNAVELAEQWTNVHDIDAAPDAQEPAGPATRFVYEDDAGRILVERYAIPGFGHATPIDPDVPDVPCGGTGDPFIRDADICSTRAIAAFFDLATAAPTVTIGASSIDGQDLSITGTADDPDGTVTEVTVRLEGAAPQPERTASGTTDWSVTFADLPDDTLYIPVATAVDDDGMRTTRTGEAVAVGTPPNNMPPELAIGTVEAEGDCIRVDGTASDADSGLASVTIALGDRTPQPASLAPTGYTFEECGLPDGAYATAVTATDTLGAATTLDGPPVEISTTRTARGTWREHMSAGRMRIYAAPCPNIGFGTCDAAFPVIFAAHGSGPFDLFSASGSDDWFLSRANVR
jgi:poly(hydroxyalkanoate) depolymerase family esterase